MHGRGDVVREGVHGRGACMPGGCAWHGGVHGRRGMHGRGHGRGACMAGKGACVAEGHAWQAEGVCVAGGMHGKGACMAGGGMRGIQSMSGQYASYWNAFFFL